MEKHLHRCVEHLEKQHSSVGYCPDNCGCEATGESRWAIGEFPESDAEREDGVRVITSGPMGRWAIIKPDGRVVRGRSRHARFWNYRLTAMMAADDEIVPSD